MNIKDFDGYFIFISGNIIGKSGKLLTVHKSDKTRPYPYVSLFKNNKVYHKMIHRLLAEHFIDNPDNKPEVNHKDGNKYNYSIDNLEWSTPLENLQHSIQNNLTNNLGGELSRNVKLTQFQVDIIRARIANGESQNKLSQEFEVHRSTINKIATGRNWK